MALIGEHDLGQATTAMGRCLFHLQRDLLVEIWTVRTQRGGHGSHLRTLLLTAPFEIAENSVPNKSRHFPYKEIVTSSIPGSPICHDKTSWPNLTCHPAAC